MFPFPPVVRSFLFSLFERAWLRTALCFCLCATVCASCSVDRHMEKKAGELMARMDAVPDWRQLPRKEISWHQALAMMMERNIDLKKSEQSLKTTKRSVINVFTQIIPGVNLDWMLTKELSDLAKVTASDVVASYKQAMENDYYKYRFYKHLLEVKETEDGGILFQMDTAYQNLALLLDVPIVKASEVANLTEAPAGSGPYVFVESSGGAVLQRNPNWWCGDLKIPARDNTINLTAVSTTAEVRDAFQFNGDNSVSVVCTNPMSDSFAEYRCDYELWEIESGYMIYLGCNILYSEHFDDGTLRTFLTYGIDRESLAESAYKGLVSPVTLPCAPTESYYSKSLAAKYAYDPMKFIEKLSAYRIPQKDGADKELRILVNSDDSARTRIARDLASNLTALGLPATTLESGGTLYKNTIVAGNFDVYLGMTRLSPDMDLTEFFRPYGEMSRGGMSHEILYNMCLKALEDSGNYYNFYQKLAEDGRIIPMMFGYYNVYAHRGVLPDLNPARDNVFYYSMGKTMADALIEETAE